MKNPRTKSYTIAMASVFAALYFVLRSLPNPIPFLFQMIGISGRFTAGDFLLTTIALVAGSWGGILAVFVGTVLAYPISGPLFLGLDFLPGVVNVLVAGLIIASHHRAAQTIYGAVLLLFLANPYSLVLGYGYIPYAWLHIVALAILLSPIITRVPDWIMRNGYRQFTAIAVLAFVGTMAQHLTGGLLFEFTVGLVQGNSPSILRGDWAVIFWLYPTERIIITAVSTVISVGLIRSMSRLGGQLEIRQKSIRAS
jgi:hypothetical protein